MTATVRYLHTNTSTAGGGSADTARVDATAYVGPGARVYGEAQPVAAVVPTVSATFGNVTKEELENEEL